MLDSLLFAYSKQQVAPRAGTPGFRALEVLCKCSNQGTGWYFKWLLFNTGLITISLFHKSHFNPHTWGNRVQVQNTRITLWGMFGLLHWTKLDFCHPFFTVNVFHPAFSHRCVVSWSHPALPAQWPLPVLQSQWWPDCSHSDHDYTRLQRNHSGCQGIR